MPPAPLRVAHVSSFVKGGAAIAAQRICQSVDSEDTSCEFFHAGVHDNADAEIDAHILPRQPVAGAKWLRALRRDADASWRPFYGRLRRKHTRGRPDRRELFSPGLLRHDTALDASQMNCDVIHLHWVARHLDIPFLLQRLPRELPVVWTLHDMNPFTGGCHYSFGCEQFKTGCGNCPQLARAHDGDLSRRIVETKQQAYDGRKLAIVTPSRWLLEHARQSQLFSNAQCFHHIPYGIDLEAYRPVTKKVAKQSLGLGKNETVVLFGADDTGNERKGFAYLTEALEQLASSTHDIRLLTFGHATSASQVPDAFPHLHLGYLDSAEEKRIAYSAADLFVLPSIEDNSPQTVIESMACGTCVVSFASGGAAELVVDGQTGFLATPLSSTSLAERIKVAARNVEACHQYGHASRQMIEREHSYDLQASRYRKLYAELAGRHASYLKGAA